MPSSDPVQPLARTRCVLNNSGQDCHLTIDLTLAANRLGSGDLPQRWEDAIRGFLKGHGIVPGNAGGDEHARLMLRQNTNPDGSEQHHILCIGLTCPVAMELGNFMDKLYADTVQVGKTNFGEQIASQINARSRERVVFANQADTQLGTTKDSRAIADRRFTVAL